MQCAGLIEALFQARQHLCRWLWIEAPAGKTACCHIRQYFVAVKSGWDRPGAIGKQTCYVCLQRLGG